MLAASSLRVDATQCFCVTYRPLSTAIPGMSLHSSGDLAPEHLVILATPEGSPSLGHRGARLRGAHVWCWSAPQLIPSL